MDDIFNDLLHNIQSNYTVKHDTGCLITDINPHHGCAYPKVTFTYLHKPFKINVHTFVFKMLNGVPPYAPNRPHYEHSHLCHNHKCFRLSHIRVEPHNINTKRKICNRKNNCQGHGEHEQCLSL